MQTSHITRVVLTMALMVPSPGAWAQLADVDPALSAAVEALVAHDPELAADPELAELCRDIAEATIVDPRERAAVAYEVVSMQREGVDVATVVPPEVRDAARGELERMQEQARQLAESLSPEERQHAELMMREASRQFDAWESGDRYVPSTEMVEVARGMFDTWAEDATPEQRQWADQEFARWSSGDLMGPGFEMMGPGHEGGMGSPPPKEHFDQLLAEGQINQEEYAQALEGMQAFQEWETAGRDPEKFKELMEQFGGMHEGEFGSWEGHYAGDFEFGQEAYGPGGFETYGAEFGASPMEAFEHWAGSEQFSPEMEAQYREMAEQYQQEFETHVDVENNVYDSQQAQYFDQYGGGSQPQTETLVATHDHDLNGLDDEYHYDTNSDGIADHAHSTPH